MWELVLVGGGFALQGKQGREGNGEVHDEDRKRREGRTGIKSKLPDWATS